MRSDPKKTAAITSMPALSDIAGSEKFFRNDQLLDAISAKLSRSVPAFTRVVDKGCGVAVDAKASGRDGRSL